MRSSKHSRNKESNSLLTHLLLTVRTIERRVSKSTSRIISQVMLLHMKVMCFCFRWVDTPSLVGFSSRKLDLKLTKEVLFLQMIIGKLMYHTFTVLVMSLKVLCLRIKPKKKVSQLLNTFSDKAAMLTTTLFPVLSILTLKSLGSASLKKSSKQLVLITQKVLSPCLLTLAPVLTMTPTVW